ncbi:hypothetical protein HYPSUDRAFT_201392 [Hypholoma sublateritium FD-334 SS-4]|uniref:Uncharacterized protein n=1 Tax=Hypholoma sublateritium (strain FD-334 SS-4) TaxID=945553 RepID=A0A0D2NX45_HYPSF|nr:hypothetical protein HYPSUDRAFT_201392 [Hypholoma sublateritium FD-334 SS-4]
MLHQRGREALSILSARLVCEVQPRYVPCYGLPPLLTKYPNDLSPIAPLVPLLRNILPHRLPSAVLRRLTSTFNLPSSPRDEPLPGVHPPVSIASRAHAPFPCPYRTDPPPCVPASSLKYHALSRTKHAAIFEQPGSLPPPARADRPVGLSTTPAAFIALCSVSDAVYRPRCCQTVSWTLKNEHFFLPRAPSTLRRRATSLMHPTRVMSKGGWSEVALTRHEYSVVVDAPYGIANPCSRVRQIAGEKRYSLPTQNTIAPASVPPPPRRRAPLRPAAALRSLPPCRPPIRTPLPLQPSLPQDASRPANRRQLIPRRAAQGLFRPDP